MVHKTTPEVRRHSVRATRPLIHRQLPGTLAPPKGWSTCSYMHGTHIAYTRHITRDTWQLTQFTGPQLHITALPDLQDRSTIRAAVLQTLISRSTSPCSSAGSGSSCSGSVPQGCCVAKSTYSNGSSSSPGIGLLWTSSLFFFLDL